MPGVRGSADAVGEVDGGVLFVGLPLAALAPVAAHEGEDPGGPGRPDCELPGVRSELDSRGGTSRLGTVLLSPLPQTGLAPAAHAVGRGVRPRGPLRQGSSTRRARAPWQPFPDRRMVPSVGYSRRVDGMKGAAPDPWGWMRMSGNVGSVTRDRYDELVKLGRDWVAKMSSAQWRLGDAALEIEPMRSYGGANPSGKDDLFTVSEAIRMFAEDVGLAYTTVRSYRWVSSRWPKERRQADVSHTIHKVLASISDEQERFEAVNNPPPNPRGGPPRWTHDSAKRVVGWKVDSPESVQEKVEAIHDLAADDAVAAVVTTDFLRRPAVANKAMADDTARHAVNEAQFDRFRQQAQFVHEEAAPQLQRMEHSAQFMDLVAACAQFVATAGRIVPNLRGEHYDDGERETIGRGLSRVRAAADWIENAVTRGEVDLDEQLEKLLKGSGE